MSQTLSWSLVVSTYQREKILYLCLKLAAEQTRQPIEIIVIDGSPNWEMTRDKVISEIASAHPNIRWIYTSAEVLSLTLQRNQGLRLATGDVAFLIDDDSLMYPTCAEEIMRVYEADTDSRLVGVAAGDAPTSPFEEPIDDAKKMVGYSTQAHSFLTSSLKFLWKHLFLMDLKTWWIPYDGELPRHPLPDTVRGLNIVAIEQCFGYQMTFRRNVALKEPFEPLLRNYSSGEDQDFINRITRYGPLVLAHEGKLHHFRSAKGRLSRFAVEATVALNQALFLRKNSSNLERDKKRYYVLALRRLLADFLKDFLSRRWSFPQLRGSFFAVRHSSKVFSLPDDRLAEWYPQFQQDIIKASKTVANQEKYPANALKIPS